MMGNNNITEYKVLWVTGKDDFSIIGSHKEYAYKKYKLKFKTFPNWDEAEADLNKKFKDYSAIVLSPQCKLHSDDKNDNVSALMVVLSQLREIFALRYDTIAWYILSTGAEWDTERERNTVKEIWDRMSLNGDWGVKMAFEVNADADMDVLYAQIKDVAEKRQQNVIMFRHKETLSYIGENSTIKFEGARKDLVNVLVALYNPHFKLDTVKVYKNYANTLRKILESMFIAAGERGILPIECFKDRDKTRPILKKSVDYMAGFSVSMSNDNKVIRWGKTKNDIGGVFSPEDAKYLYEMLDYFNRVSHFQDSDKIDDDKELFFSYCMRLCHIIRRFGDYVKANNPNPTTSKSYVFMDVSNPKNPDDVINTKATVKEDNGVLHMGKCKLDGSLIKGQIFIVEAAMVNSNTNDNATYPFVATKIRPSIFVQDISRATVVGETFNVNDLSINGNDYYFKCKYLENYKLSSVAINDINAKKNIKNWKIDEVEDSDEGNNWEYPFIVTKIDPA